MKCLSEAFLLPVDVFSIFHLNSWPFINFRTLCYVYTAIFSYHFWLLLDSKYSQSGEGFGRWLNCFSSGILTNLNYQLFVYSKISKGLLKNQVQVYSLSVYLSIIIIIIYLCVCTYVVYILIIRIQIIHFVNIFNMGWDKLSWFFFTIHLCPKECFFLQLLQKE